MIKERKIPSIIGILILLAGIAGGVFFVQRGGVWFLKAKPTEIPKQVKVTNISDNGFTVSWITEEEVAGFVKYGLGSTLDSTAVDDRDQISGETTFSTIHHVTVRGLEPGTTYYFKIGSGKKLYDNNGKLYEVTTAPKTAAPLPPSDPVYGTVVKPDNSPAAGVIVYLSLTNASPLSALTKSSGSWLITLNNARTADLSSYASYDREASIEEIFVQGGKMGTATAVVTTKNDSPVPTITLGKSYDFRQAKELVRPEATSPPISKFSLEPIGTPSAAAEKELAIINPEENEEIATQKPEIRGVGPKGAKLKITLESPEVFVAEVTIDEDGTWSWAPSTNLPPGEHTITVTLADGTSTSRSFVVLAAGEGGFPAFEATPSAVATPSPTPTATPSPRAGIPSTDAGVPEPGYLTPTFLLAIMGIGLTLLGSISNILSKKNV